MGQAEVLTILENNKDKWYTIKELQQEIKDVSIGSIGNSVKKLKKSRMVKAKNKSYRNAMTNKDNRSRIFIKYKEEEEV